MVLGAYCRVDTIAEVSYRERVFYIDEGDLVLGRYDKKIDFLEDLHMEPISTTNGLILADLIMQEIYSRIEKMLPGVGDISPKIEITEKVDRPNETRFTFSGEIKYTAKNPNYIKPKAW